MHAGILLCLGTVKAPLLARPFISHNAIPDIPTSHYCNPSREDNTTKCDNITRALFPNCTDSSESSLQFGWSYWISAIGMLIVAIPLIYFAGCTKRRHPKLYTEIIDPATLVLVDEHLEVTGMVTAILVNGAAQGDMVCFH